MRKLIESALLSLDGVIGDPMKWAGAYFDDTAAARALEQLHASDAMLMGRGTYQYFAPTWPSAPGAYAARLNTMPKYVFSSTLATAEWSNCTVVGGDGVQAVTELKRQPGRDLIIYGHGRLAQTLLRHRLIDELRLAVHPLLVGHGALLFHEDESATMELVAAQPLEKGVIALTYRPNLS